MREASLMKTSLHPLPILIALACTLSLVPLSGANWQPADGPLSTRWAAEVDPSRGVLPEYPRPQLVRDNWLNLNGLWDLAITPRTAVRPDTFAQKILVPFPVESALSGVMRNVTENDRLWYRRTFEIPAGWEEQRVLLHFGAVDFEAVVWLNGHELGQHRGGYDPFHFDITDALRTASPNELVVAVWDPTDAGTQPRGKQVRRPDRGIFYTAASGIWQTVWLEPVPVTRVRHLSIVPDIDTNRVRVRTEITGANANTRLELEAMANGRRVARATGTPGEELILSIRRPRLWSPEDPFLYDLTVRVRQGRETTDVVTSYFGMRKVGLGQDEQGITRLFLNNEPYFMVGFLDQGYWPDGIYTAPTDEALRYDIEVTRQLGFNLARKHVKIEPARWYYWADRLGLIVWQDMPSGDRFIGSNDPDLVRTPESAAPV
jgi:beta-galactosidase/beta-glucuronidase